MGTKKNIMVGASYLAIAAIAVGGTLAFLDDSTPTTTNVIMTDGKVDIVQIEQQRVDDKENQTVLEDFEQCKQMLPAMFNGTSIPFAAESEWVVPGDQAWKVVEDNDNVIDKFVTVKNTGNIPAYVRTVIAFESGCRADDTKLHVVHNGKNVEEEIGEWEWVENVTIDGKKFDIGVCTYQKALLPNETTIPSLKQVYLNKSLTAEEIEELYGDSCEILVMSQACQVESSKTAKEVLDNAFQPITATSHPWTNGTNSIVYASSAEEIQEALTAGSDIILENNIQDSADTSTGYGVASIIHDGGTIFGSNLTYDVSDANGTWDCAIYTKGGTIRNLKVTGAFRAIFTGGLNEDIIIDNCTLDATYPFNADNGGAALIVKNSQLLGWTSYASTLTSAEFDNCEFGSGTSGYAYLKPFTDTILTNCNFEEGFQVDASKANITFVNCTLNGVALDNTNISTLVTSGTAIIG